MFTWVDAKIAAERRKDLMRETQQERLAQLAALAERNPGLSQRIEDWLFEQLRRRQEARGRLGSIQVPNPSPARQNTEA